MKKGFTIIEVSILFVIFLIVAFLVAPLSIDDTSQAKNTSRWRSVQQNFNNIYYTAISGEDLSEVPLEKLLKKTLKNEFKTQIEPYKILFLNNSTSDFSKIFSSYYVTNLGSTIAFKFYDNPIDKKYGILIYDVNGQKGPNICGKDVFGFNIYENAFEPMGKRMSISSQKKDCSKSGTGLYCSNYYLIGGSFD